MRDKKVVFRSFSGCPLGSLPEISEFVFNTSRQYYGLNLEFTGGEPRLVFLSKYNTELNTVPVRNMKVKEIQQVLAENGFEPDPTLITLPTPQEYKTFLPLNTGVPDPSPCNLS